MDLHRDGVQGFERFFLVSDHRNFCGDLIYSFFQFPEPTVDHIDVDIVFMDPPYGKDYEYDVLNALSHSDIIDKYTIIIIEEALNVPLDYIDECGFETVKVKNYKTNKHIFIRLKESE